MRTTFAFRYGLFRPLLVLLGMGRSFADVVLEPDHVVVRMGWGFRARIPRGNIRRLYRDRDMRGRNRGAWLARAMARQRCG